MDLIIKEICEQIEKEKNIKILFCVESGSRVWRLDSKDSDYDVRFVFVRPLDDYITINKKEEVITKNYDKLGNPCQAEGCYIDVCGFDIFKFTKMLSSSNPTTIEWLQSDIIYSGEKPKEFIDFANNCFNPISLYHHYKSMCRQNYLKYLKSGNLVSYKKYLYAMRGLINAKYVAQFKKLPFIDFTRTIDVADLNINRNIIEELKKIIKLKKESKEKDIVKNIVKIDNYIEDFLKVDEELPKQRSTLNELDNTLKKIIKGEK